MADHGLKISIDDVDVKTATDDQLVFTTKYSMLKIAKVGTFSKTFSSNPGSGCQTLGSVAHGFDYVPAHDCFFNKNTTAYTKLPYFFDNGDLSPFEAYTQYIVSTYCDATNIYFRLCRDDTNGGDPFDFTGETWDFKYYIFADPGA